MSKPWSQKRPQSMTETVPALPGESPDGVAPDPSTVTAQLVKSLTPIGAYRTDDHRYYWNGVGPFPSVTTVLGILDKPAVVTWKAKETAKAMINLAHREPELADYAWQQLGDLDGPHDVVDDLVLKALAEADKTRDTAAALGSSVHLLADLLGASQDDSAAFQVSDREIPYVEAFRAFLARYSASSIVSSEKMVWNLNGYAGTYDLLMTLPGDHPHTPETHPELDCMEAGAADLWLIDIKTSKGYYPEYGLQLAAYAHADQIILPGDPRVYPMPLIQRTGILHLRPDAYPDTGYRLIEYSTSDRDYIAFLGALEVYNWKSEQRFLKSKLIVSKP